MTRHARIKAGFFFLCSGTASLPDRMYNFVTEEQIQLTGWGVRAKQVGDRDCLYGKKKVPKCCSWTVQPH